MATSAPLDQPTVWKDTLPVSWECEASIDSFQIYMFLPAAISTCLFFLWVISTMCITRYCDSRKIQQAKSRIWIAVIMVVTIMLVVIAICFILNVLWIQKVVAAFSWSCHSVRVQLFFILCVPLHFSMAFFIILR